MGLTVYSFIFWKNGAIKRLPMACWNRIPCTAYAYIELRLRKPLYCHRIEGVKYHIDHDDVLDEHYTFMRLASPLESLIEENDTNGNTAIHAESRFKMERHKYRCAWALSK